MEVIITIFIFSLVNYILCQFLYKKNKLQTCILYPSYIYGLYMCKELGDLKTLYIATYSNPKQFIKVKAVFEKEYNYKNLFNAYCYNEDTLRVYDFKEIYKIQTDSFYFKVFTDLILKETKKLNNIIC